MRKFFVILPVFLLVGFLAFLIIDNPPRGIASSFKRVSRDFNTALNAILPSQSPGETPEPQETGMGMVTTDEPGSSLTSQATAAEKSSLPAPKESEGEAAGQKTTATQTSTPTPRTDVLPAVTKTPYCAWQMVFSDDFQGSQLNKERWNPDYPAGKYESQYYVPDAFEVKNGVLKIKAEKRKVKDRQYTSGIITTQGIFDQKYGLFEIRAKVPHGQGLWPAFWLLPTTKNYPWEIDVFEILGHDTHTVYMTNHWPGKNGENNHDSKDYTGQDFSDGFHTFAVKWSDDELTWYIDGVKRAHTGEGVPQEKMFMLVNLAVGGKWPGYPDDSTPFPSYMEVDYVHVYQWSCPESGAE